MGQTAEAVVGVVPAIGTRYEAILERRAFSSALSCVSRLASTTPSSLYKRHAPRSRRASGTTSRKLAPPGTEASMDANPSRSGLFISGRHADRHVLLIADRHQRIADDTDDAFVFCQSRR